MPSSTPAFASFHRSIPSLARSGIALAFSLVLGSSQSARAATFYWNTIGANTPWTTAADWSDNPTSGGATGTVPTATDSAWFNQSSINGNSSVLLNGPTAIAGITFANTGNTTLSPSGSPTLSLGAGGLTVNSGAGTVTLGATPISLTADQAWTNSSSNKLTIGGAISSASATPLTLTTGGPGMTILNGIVSDGASAVSLVVNGGTTALNNGANTFTGGVIVSNGATLQTTAQGATKPFGTGKITLGGGGTAGTLSIPAFGNTANYSNAIQLGGVGSTGTIQYETGQFLTLSGAIDLNGGNLTYKLIGAGSGALILTGSTTGLGNITFDNEHGAVTGGINQNNLVNNNGTITNIGTGATATSISGGVGSNVTAITENSAVTALTINTSSTITPSLSVNSAGTTLTNNNSSGSAKLTVGGIVNGTGNLILNNNSAINGGITLSGGSNIFINNTGTIINSGIGVGKTQITGNIGASVKGITQNSATSALELSGQNSQYAGNTTITTGTLIMLGSASLGTGGNLAIGKTGTFDMSGGVNITMSATRVISGSGLILAAGKVLTVQGTISPGDGDGNTLSFKSGTLSLTNTTKFVFDLGTATGSDEVDMSGATLNLAAAIDFSSFQFNIGSAFDPSSSYTLFTNASTLNTNGFTSKNGTFDDGRYTGTLTVSGNNLILTNIVPTDVPEPSSVALLVPCVFGLLARRRPRREATA